MKTIELILTIIDIAAISGATGIIAYYIIHCLFADDKKIQ